MGDRFGHRGLAGARHVVDEDVAFGEQPAQGEAHGVALASDDLLDAV
jgi:hypothetical protein